MDLLQTYELHLEGGACDGKFVPLTCTEQEVVSRALDVLSTNGASGCEVRQFDRPLFSLLASEAS